MKVNKLAAACMVATASLAQAEVEESIEFHGYFRAGMLADVEDSYTQYDGGVKKETVGRLGTETDDWWEAELVKGWNLDDGKWVKIHFRMGSQNMYSNNAETMFGQSIDAKETGLLNSYVELGMFEDPDTVLWAGQRFYNRDNYSFIADLFYTDHSGTGIGIQNLKTGGGKMDIAYIASDITQSNGWTPGDTDAVMHAFHLGYNTGQWDIELMAKNYPTNGKTDNTDGTPYTTVGYEATAIYSFDQFYGGSNGFSKAAIQVGKGLGAGPALGATVNTYTSYRLGNGPQSLVERKPGDKSVRFVTHGGYIGKDFMVFPHLMIQDDSFEGGNGQRWTSLIVRPVVPVTEHFSLAIEAGIDDLQTDDDNDANDGKQYKVMFAPTWTVNTTTGPSPEARLFVGYLGGDEERGMGDNNKGPVVGFQADLWW